MSGSRRRRFDTQGKIENLYPSFGFLEVQETSEAIFFDRHACKLLSTGQAVESHQHNLTRYYRQGDLVYVTLETREYDEARKTSIAPGSMFPIPGAPNDRLKSQWHGFGRISRIENGSAGFIQTTDGAEVYLNKSMLFPTPPRIKERPLDDVLEVGWFVRFIADPIVAYPQWRATSVEPHEPELGWDLPQKHQRAHKRCSWALCCKADMDHVAGCLFLEGRYFAPYPRRQVILALDALKPQPATIKDPKRFAAVTRVAKGSKKKLRHRGHPGSDDEGLDMGARSKSRAGASNSSDSEIEIIEDDSGMGQSSGSGGTYDEGSAGVSPLLKSACDLRIRLENNRAAKAAKANGKTSVVNSRPFANARRNTKKSALLPNGVHSSMIDNPSGFLDGAPRDYPNADKNAIGFRTALIADSDVTLIEADGQLILKDAPGINGSENNGLPGSSSGSQITSSKAELLPLKAEAGQHNSAIASQSLCLSTQECISDGELRSPNPTHVAQIIEPTKTNVSVTRPSRTPFTSDPKAASGDISSDDDSDEEAPRRLQIIEEPDSSAHSTENEQVDESPKTNSSIFTSSSRDSPPPTDDQRLQSLIIKEIEHFQQFTVKSEPSNPTSSSSGERESGIEQQKSTSTPANQRSTALPSILEGEEELILDYDEEDLLDDVTASEVDEEQLLRMDPTETASSQSTTEDMDICLSDESTTGMVSVLQFESVEFSRHAPSAATTATDFIHCKRQRPSI